MTKREKEADILKGIENLKNLDNIEYHGYIRIGELIDIIAMAAFGCTHKRDFAGEVIYPTDIDEYTNLMGKIGTVINGMVNNDLITISKSKKMFKPLF